MTTPNIKLRPVQGADSDFLFRVFSGTRTDITTATHITEPMKSQLMNSQFKAQSQHYAEHFPQASHRVIQLGDQPVGRLYVNRTPDEIHILDISILPDFCGEGIGRCVMLNILAEARISGRPVRIHVEVMNRAVRFYERLGFETIANKQTHYEMKWSPNTSGQIDLPADT